MIILGLKPSLGRLLIVAKRFLNLPLSLMLIKQVGLLPPKKLILQGLLYNFVPCALMFEKKKIKKKTRNV